MQHAAGAVGLPTAQPTGTGVPRSYQYISSRLIARATACDAFVETLDADGTSHIRDFVAGEDPETTFEDVLSLIPPTIDSEVKTLILTAPSLNDRLVYAAQGIRMVKPDLSACDVLLYLMRFPNVHTLEIENVNWADCSGEQRMCRCLEQLERRSYRGITLKSIVHFGTVSSAIVLLQLATAVDTLVMEGLVYEDCDCDPYPFIPVKVLVWEMPKLSLGNAPLAFGEAALERLDIAPSTAEQVDTVQSLVRNHRSTLEEFCIRLSWCCIDSAVWDDLYLSRCSRLRCVTVTYVVHQDYARYLLKTQVMLLSLIEQFPSTVQTLRLSFQTRASRVTSAYALMPRARWGQLVKRCRSMEQLSQIAVHIGLEGGGSSMTTREKADVLLELLEACADYSERRLDISVVWEDRLPDTHNKLRSR